MLPLAFGTCSPSRSSESENAKPSQVVSENKTENKFRVYALGAEPDAVTLGNKMPVLFSVLVTGGEASPESLTLIESDKDGKSILTIGVLQDNGQNGDLMQQDRIYSGTFTLSGLKEGVLFFQAQFTYANSDYRSPLYTWTVTTFPKEPHPSDPNMLVVDPVSKQKLYANEVIVSFKENTSSERIITILTEENCRLVGTIPSLGVYQILFETDKTAQAVYQMVNKLTRYKEVQYAEPNYHVELN
jgi:hypothetical protein